MLQKIKRLIPKRLKSVTEYWTEHNVTNHQEFKSARESEESFFWRTLQYPGYLELMPVNQADGKAILDYGCGPGHDAVGFVMFSQPQKLVCADISTSSLSEAKKRMNLHDPKCDVEFVNIDEQTPRLPFEDNTFDIIHCSGVLMCTREHKQILSEFKRIMKQDGYAQIMVYNYNSIWMHLYVNYIVRIQQGKYSGLSNRDAFSKTTDGPNCPYMDCYTPDEYIEFVQSVGGLICSLTGVSMSSHEMNQLPLRYKALQNTELCLESREFLYNLTFDKRGFPLYNNNVAGINACFKVAKL